MDGLPVRHERKANTSAGWITEPLPTRLNHDAVLTDIRDDIAEFKPLALLKRTRTTKCLVEWQCRGVTQRLAANPRGFDARAPLEAASELRQEGCLPATHDDCQ